MSMDSDITSSLDAHWYTDTAIYEKERRKIFNSAWWLLAPLSELTHAQAYVCDHVAGIGVVALRDDEGQLHAYHNVCRHRASPLFKVGNGRCRHIVCPYHGWTYQRSGHLASAPGFGGNIDPREADLNLFPVRVDTWNNLVFVCFDSNATSLQNWLGSVDSLCDDYPNVSDLDYYDTFDVTANANWKTYCDNTVEGYHLNHIHPRLGRALSRGRVDIKSYDDGRTVAFHVQYARGSDAESLRGDHGLWIYKYPGFQLVAGNNGFKAERVEGLAVDRLRSRNWSWFSDLPDEEKRDAFAWSERIVREDVTICEQVQTNLRAGIFSQGPLSPDKENHVARFQQLVREAVTEV